MRVKPASYRAIMADRKAAHGSADDFPTPPWAIRALCDALDNFFGERLGDLDCWEPCAGVGHMARVLQGRFREVKATDIHGGPGIARPLDFLSASARRRWTDWIVTNPPFLLAEPIARAAIGQTGAGVALLLRTQWLHGVTRWRAFHEPKGRLRPSLVMPFAERVPMVEGRLDPTASTATDYSWVIWMHGWGDSTMLSPIPPCRRSLERDGDYPGYVRDHSGRWRPESTAAAGGTVPWPAPAP